MKYTLDLVFSSMYFYVYALFMEIYIYYYILRIATLKFEMGNVIIKNRQKANDTLVLKVGFQSPT